MAIYGGGLAGLLALGRLRGQELPEKYTLRDTLVGGIATHKFSRLLSKGSVTSPIRSPSPSSRSRLARPNMSSHRQARTE